MSFYHNEVGTFSLQRYLSRYLGGGCCLEESRRVTRQMLLLSECKFVDVSPYTLALNLQNNKYIKSVQHLQKSQSIKSIQQVNNILTDNSSGQIRVAESWVGPSKKKAIYLPPKPSKLASYLKKLESYLNDSMDSSEVKAINAACTFLQIHPFVDGNGRVARALYESILHKEGESNISFFLYRFAIPQHRYIDFLQSVSIGDFNYHNNEFYFDGMSWIHGFKKEFDDVLRKYKSKVESKIFLCHLNEKDFRFLSFIWGNPIFDEFMLSLNGFESSSVKKFFNAGVVDFMTLDNKKSPIYISKDVFDFWNAVDNIISQVE
ncbi:Fic family protein [Pseudoalteromonas lipolytica]|uniref:Fic family protein n=1 Tax=Pseudoalteromonas lipolytica TaxID=570156 RepID=A0ABU8SZ51_9GAMM